MRIALIGPSHWHYPLYRGALAGEGLEIVGVCDQNQHIAAEAAAAWGCGSWSDMRAMLDAMHPGFVFAFGVHAHMPAIALELIGRGIAFSIEKPGGLHAQSVAATRKMAEAAGVFVSVPFHYRLSLMQHSLQELVDLPSRDFLAFGFRIHGGSPERFSDTSPWMTDRQLAGGGCMINLAHHPVDFALQATGAGVVEVTGQVSHKLLQAEVEDAAWIELKLDDGTCVAIETSYAHPPSSSSYMDFDVSMTHRAFTAARDGETLDVRWRDGSARRLPADWHFKRYFEDYVRATLARAAAGAPPVAGLRDLQRTMQVIDAAYESARSRRTVVPPAPI